MITGAGAGVGAGLWMMVLLSESFSSLLLGVERRNGREESYMWVPPPEGEPEEEEELPPPLFAPLCPLPFLAEAGTGRM